MTSRTHFYGTLLGWQYDRILNCLLMCLVILYFPPFLSKVIWLVASHICQVVAGSRLSITNRSVFHLGSCTTPNVHRSLDSFTLHHS